MASLREEIEVATQVDWRTENGQKLFVCVEAAAKQREHLNNLNVKKPRNLELLENETEVRVEQEPLNVPECLNAIRSSIIANGGINCSNECLEEYWRSRQKYASESNRDEEEEEEEDEPWSSASNAASTSSSLSSSSPSSTYLSKRNGRGKNRSRARGRKKNAKEKQSTEDCDSVQLEERLRRCKLSKNAAIKGLVQTHRIKLEDLRVPEAPVDKRMPKLVQHPEMPEVLVHPILAGEDINEDEYKEIDFTVPRIGRKKTVTPREYYMHATDDAYFDFVRKDV